MNDTTPVKTFAGYMIAALVKGLFVLGNVVLLYLSVKFMIWADIFKYFDFPNPNDNQAWGLGFLGAWLYDWHPSKD